MYGRRFRAAACLIAVALVVPAFTPVPGTAKGSSHTTGFSLRFKGELTSYDELGVFVMPGETVTFEAIPDGQGSKAFELQSVGGAATGVTSNRWRWHAPVRPGMAQIRISQADGHTMRLHVFVMVPAREVREGDLNGYHIGAYPARPLKDNPIYRTPEGFVEVTKHNDDTHVSPHFVLKQFLCKQAGEYPKYLILRERLLLKLEAIVEALDEHGLHGDHLRIMSGYRTPAYNRAIGDVLYSEHQWGAAADLFVDRDGDGQMDDLNRDKKFDRQDAESLAAIVDEMARNAWYQPFVGGLGTYRGTPAHGPFVHVDVRGTPARWRE